MKKLFNIILLFAVIALIGYGIYYLLDISSFNVVDETIVMSTEESYLIGVYADNEAYNDPSLYKYETTDDKVAYVDENGRIISVDKGDCEITVKRGFRSYIIKVTVFEREPLEELAGQGELMSYVYDGFWQCMDTKYEMDKLDTMLAENRAPWKKWNT